MPRLKSSQGLTGDHAAGNGPSVGTSNELQVRVGKLYLVKAGTPPVIRLARAVRTMKHHLSGRLQVYVSFPNKDKRHDALLDIGAFVEAYNAASVEMDVEGRLVRRIEQIPTGQNGTNGTIGPSANGALAAGSGGDGVGSPSVQVATLPESPRTAKRRRLNRDAPATPSSDLLDPNAAGLFNALHTPHSRTATPDKEHEAMTRVRNFDHVRFGNYLIKTWYYSPYVFLIDDPTPSTPAPSLSLEKQISSKKRGRESLLSLSHGQSPQSQNAGTLARTPGNSNNHTPNDRPKVKSVSEMLGGASSKRSGGNSAPGDRLFVCYKCFKYTKDLQRSRDHDAACVLYSPPGRQVYQRPDSQFTIWEVDGAAVPLYCQNLSLFGKLFIDHKSVFFHVENFLFYIACINTTSKYEQPVAFFSKEKVSYDDYNLACIVTFPPWQKTYKLGRLLIEFSYLLTRHPSTRSPTLSPGTPERPISDLGMKGYAAYWRSTVLRYLRTVYRSLDAALPTPAAPERAGSSPSKVKGKVAVLEMTMKDLARAVHLTEDDTAWTLQQLELVKRREGRSNKGDASGFAAVIAMRVVNGGPAKSTGTFQGAEAGEPAAEQQARVGDLNGDRHDSARSAGENGNHDARDNDDSYDDCYDDRDEDEPGNKHRQWVLDISKSKIDELCARYRVTEQPLLLESAVKL